MAKTGKQVKGRGAMHRTSLAKEHVRTCEKKGAPVPQIRRQTRPTRHAVCARQSHSTEVPAHTRSKIEEDVRRHG